MENDYVIANISQKELEQIKALEHEITKDSKDDIVLIAYSKETES